MNILQAMKDALIVLHGCDFDSLETLSTVTSNLQAVIDEMEKAEPVGWITKEDAAILRRGFCAASVIRSTDIYPAYPKEELLYLYANPAPAILEGWKLMPTDLTTEQTKEKIMDSIQQAQVAAKMASYWWVKRLNIKYAEYSDALAAAIEQRVADTLNGVAYWNWEGVRYKGSGKPEIKCNIECDYQPKGLLASAVMEVFDDLKPFQLLILMQDIFPSKHSLQVTREVLHPKEGYGHWIAAIVVPSSAKL